MESPTMSTDRRICPIGRRGFTLMEATLAMVLLGMAAAGVLLPFTGGASAQADGNHRTIAAILANDQIERIVSIPFAQLVAQLAQYSYVESKGQVQDASGALLRESDPMYANFSRQTTCQRVYVPQQSGAAAANFVLATVSVSYQGQGLVTVRRLISQ
jgi:prepilin-type N-terminal cleavage/methylation domain-containing protein